MISKIDYFIEEEKKITEKLSDEEIRYRENLLFLEEFDGFPYEMEEFVE